MKSVKPIIFIPSLNFNSFSTTILFMINTEEDINAMVTTKPTNDAAMIPPKLYV